MSDKKKISEKYPPNSKIKKEKVEKGEVITNKAKRRKKTGMQKFIGNFIGEDIDNVGSYIMNDVLIPAAKNTIVELVTGGLDMIFYGEKTRRHRRSGLGTGSFVSYNKASSKSSRFSTKKTGMVHDFDSIIFETKGEAQKVLDYLVDLTIDRGEATVADFYRAVGERAEFTDESFGWTRLNTARLRRINSRDGVIYSISFPRTEEL